jgi:hypothetical protein
LLEAITRQLLVKTLQAGKDLACALVIYKVEISDGTIIKCNYELCVKVVNESNIQSKTPPRVTQNCDNIILQQYHTQQRTYMQPESVRSAARRMRKSHHVHSDCDDGLCVCVRVCVCVFCIFINIAFYLHSEWKQ